LFTTYERQYSLNMATGQAAQMLERPMHPTNANSSKVAVYLFCQTANRS